MDVLCLDASKRFAAVFSASAPEDAPLADGYGRVTIRAASQMCWTSVETIELWIMTGLWPLPCAVRRQTCFFNRSDVDCWVATGQWPGEPHFQRQHADDRVE